MAAPDAQKGQGPRNINLFSMTNHGPYSIWQQNSLKAAFQDIHFLLQDPRALELIFIRQEKGTQTETLDGPIRIDSQIRANRLILANHFRVPELNPLFLRIALETSGAYKSAGT